MLNKAVDWLHTMKLYLITLCKVRKAISVFQIKTWCSYIGIRDKTKESATTYNDIKNERTKRDFLALSTIY